MLFLVIFISAMVILGVIGVLLNLPNAVRERWLLNKLVQSKKRELQELGEKDEQYNQRFKEKEIELNNKERSKNIELKNREDQLNGEYLEKESNLKAELKYKEDKFRMECFAKENELENKEYQLNREYLEKENNLKEEAERIVQDKDALEILVKEKTEGFPWLAEAWADFKYFGALKKAGYMEDKTHPAPHAADDLREMAKKRREAEKELRIAKYILKYYEDLFPFLIDYRGEDIDDLIKQLANPQAIEEIDEDDPVMRWIPQSEYKKLPSVERNQQALDNYQRRKKRPWEIGRDYERYIGYLYEKDGYKVQYYGIIEGYEDLGRDLICRKGDAITIIQCKCWGKHHVIHEKHINQLFGTVVKYLIELKEEHKIDGSLFQLQEKVKAILHTSTTLSEKAKEFAKALKITIKENFPLEPYPCIKCNISYANQEKIYHLPFDQQYDKTIISPERGERYVVTVAEAEKLGFRRAYRWHGQYQEAR